MFHAPSMQRCATLRGSSSARRWWTTGPLGSSTSPWYGHRSLCLLSSRRSDVSVHGHVQPFWTVAKEVATSTSPCRFRRLQPPTKPMKVMTTPKQVMTKPMKVMTRPKQVMTTPMKVMTATNGGILNTFEFWLPAAVFFGCHKALYPRNVQAHLSCLLSRPLQKAGTKDQRLFSHGMYRHICPVSFLGLWKRLGPKIKAMRVKDAS